MSDIYKENENISQIILTKFFRIKDVTYWVAITVLGFVLGLSSLSFSVYIIPFLVLIINAYCIGLFTFVINNLYDIEADKINPRRRNINAIASGEISEKTSKIFILILAIIPLFVSFLFGKFQLLLFSAILILMGWIYSAPPLRVKGLPGLDIIWHFFGFFLIVIYGSYIAGSVEFISILVAVSAGIFSCIYQIVNHILDYSYDKESKTVTFVVWLGLDKARFYMNSLIIIHIIIIIPIILLYVIISTVGYLFFVGSILISLFLSRVKKTSDVRKFSPFVFIYYLTIFTYMNCALNVLISFMGSLSF